MGSDPGKRAATGCVNAEVGQPACELFFQESTVGLIVISALKNTSTVVNNMPTYA